MKKGWFLLEIFPRKAWRSQWKPQSSLLGFYIPLGQRRFIEPDADIRPTVQQRKADPSSNYGPSNLP